MNSESTCEGHALLMLFSAPCAASGVLSAVQEAFPTAEKMLGRTSLGSLEKV